MQLHATAALSLNKRRLLCRRSWRSAAVAVDGRGDRRAALDAAECQRPSLGLASVAAFEALPARSVARTRIV
jgi:hypothetical protein